MAENVFGRALLRGIDQDQAMAYAFTKTIGDLTGFDALSAWGEEGALRNLREAAENPAELQSWDDVDSLADFGTYVIEALGENASGIITGAATGFGVGGIAGGVAKAGAKRKLQAAFGKKLQQSLPTEAFENFAKQRAQRIGFAAGAGANATVVNTGETQLQFDERGIDNPGGALAAGVLKGALDVVGLDRIVRASRAVGTTPDTLIDLTVNILKEARITGTTEGVTEGFQTVIDLVAVKANDPEFDFFSVENLKEVREAVLKGGIAGGGIGGGVAGVVQTVDYNRARNNTIEETAGEAEAQQREPELERISEPYAGAKDRPVLTQEQIDEYAREDAEISARLLAEQDAEKAAREAIAEAGIPDAEGFMAAMQSVYNQEKDTNEKTVDPVTGREFDAIGLMEQMKAEGNDARGGLEFSRRRGYTPEQIAEFEAFLTRFEGLSAEQVDAAQSATAILNGTIGPLAELGNRDLPIPEAQAVIDAQAEAVRDPTSDKSSVLVTPGSPDPTDTTGLEQSQEFTDTDGNQQRVFSNDPVAIAALGRERDLDEETAGNILFNREGGKDDADGNIIVSRNADGVPVSEIATSAARREEDIATAEGIAPEGGSVEEVPAPAVLGERIARLAAEFRGDTEPVGAPQITSLLERLTPEQMAAVQEQMRGSRLETQRLADSMVELATQAPESSNLGTAVDTYESPALRVGEEPAQPIVSFPDELNRGNRYYASQAAAERAAARAEPDPNRIGNPQVVEVEPGKFGVRVETLPQELAPEQVGAAPQSAVVPVQRENSSSSDQRVRPRRDQSPASETAIANAGIAKARNRGASRLGMARPTGPKQVREAQKREEANPGTSVRAGQSIIPVIDPQGATRWMTTKDLADSGKDLLRTRGGAEPTAAEGFAAMLGELQLRGYNTEQAVPGGQIDPNLLLDHGRLENPADNQRDLTAAQANARRESRVGRPNEGVEELTANEQARVEETRNTAELEEVTEIEKTEEQLDSLRKARRRAKAAGRPTAGIDRRGKRLRADVEGRKKQIERIENKRAIDKERQARDAAGKTENSQTEGLDQETPLQTRGSVSRPADDTRARARQAAEVSAGNTLGVGRSVTKQEVAFVNGVMDEIGLSDVPVTILDVPALQTNRGAAAAGPRAQEALERFQSDPKLMATTYRHRGNIIIMVRGYSKDTAAARANRLLFLGHEIGHHVFDSAVKNLPPKIRTRLEKMFEADKAKTPTEDWQGPNGFTEWFSDKVAARARKISEKPTDIADRYFRAAAQQLEKIWKALKGKIPQRFHVNRSFDTVVAQMKEADIFDVAEILQDTTTGLEAIHFDPATVGSQINRATLRGARMKFNRLLDRTINVPGLGFSFFTTDGRLRAIDAALANDHYQPSNTTLKTKSFHTGVTESRYKWKGQVIRTIAKYADDPDTVRKAFNELSREVPTADLTTDLAKELREILDRFYEDYLSPRMPELTKVDNYFPRAYNVLQIGHDRAGFEALLQKYGVENSDKVWESITREPDAYTSESLKRSVEGWQRERVFTDQKLVDEMIDAGFLNADPVGGLMAYIHKATNRAEYERVWGGHRKDGSYDPQHKILKRINNLPRGQRKEALALHMSTVHPRHADPTNKWHALVGEVKAYQAVRLLAFSGVASVPETGGVLLRSKGGLDTKQLAADIRDTIKNPQDAREFAEALGIISNVMGASAATEAFLDPTLAGGAPYAFFRKAAPYVFRFNGNDAVTNFSRTLGAAIGKTFVTQQAENIENGVNVQRSTRYLRELGVKDHRAILRWAEAGSPVWSHLLEGQEAADADIGSNAVIRYVEESVIHPNSSERPSWATHPVGGLFFNLKAFAVSFNKNILGGVYREIENRLDEGGVRNLGAYLPFLMAMTGVFVALGAASDELRERVKSLGARGTLAKHNYDPTRLAKKWFDRAGFTSLPYSGAIFDPTLDNVAYAAGPAPHQVYKLMGLLDDKDLKNEELKALLDASPVLSQMPSFRREIYELLE